MSFLLKGLRPNAPDKEQVVRAFIIRFFFQIIRSYNIGKKHMEIYLIVRFNFVAQNIRLLQQNLLD